MQAEDGGGVCAEDLRATLRVLAALAHNPDLYRSKGLRSVRALVHSLSEEQLAKTEAGFTARISQALAYAALHVRCTWLDSSVCVTTHIGFKGWCAKV